jgi:CHASE2 domain-containing sensor protein
MNFKFTHYLFYFRKFIRNNAQKGSLKKIIISFFLSLFLTSLFFGNKFFFFIDEVLIQKINYQMRGNLDAPDNIVIIRIDDKSYTKLGLSVKKPFPRPVIAKALKRLQEDKPSLVVLDLNFPIDSKEEGTYELARAMQIGPTVFQRVTFEGYENSISEPSVIAAAQKEIPLRLSPRYGITYLLSGNAAKNEFSIEEDFPLIEPLRLFVKNLDKVPEKFDLINFYGEPGLFRSFSIWELFDENSKIPKDFFKGKVVFLGFQTLSADKNKGHHLIPVAFLCNFCSKKKTFFSHENNFPASPQYGGNSTTN